MTYFSLYLEEGMKKSLEYKHSFRLWVTPGLPIEIKFLAGKENITNIYVSKNLISSNCKYSLGVIVDQNGTGFIEELEPFSELWELKEKHLHLFEVPGTLYIFP